LPDEARTGRDIVMRALRLTLLLVAGALSGNAVSAPALAGGQEGSSSALVKLAPNEQLKKSILVDQRGFTLYMFSRDSRNKPTCYNDAQYHCSKAWRPLRSTGAPRAGQGVKASLLGTATRTDGADQVTYNGHPLYTNAGAPAFALKPDRKVGDLNGLGFSDIWFAVSPTGKKIAH
jgi:predicted lipoprotein with Yx(FWY)xxD motif